MHTTKDILIAIPTFNRYDQLTRLLKELSVVTADYSEHVDICVIDNHSLDERYGHQLEAYAKSIFRSNNCKIIHNPANLGFSGNYFKCLEAAVGYEWMWAIGDDDQIKPGFSFSELIDLLGHLHKSVSYVGFSSEIGSVSAKKDIPIHDRETLLKEVRMGTLLFISTVVYRVAPTMQCISRGILAAHSHCPHVAIIVSSVSDDCMFYPSSLVPIQWNPSAKRIDEDTALQTGHSIVYEVFGLIRCVPDISSRRLMYQALSASYVGIHEVMQEAYYRHPKSYIMRLLVMFDYSVNTILLDRRWISKIGALLSLFMCHGPMGMRLFFWLRQRARKIFPRKRKTPDLNY